MMQKLKFWSLNNWPQIFGGRDDFMALKHWLFFLFHSAKKSKTTVVVVVLKIFVFHFQIFHYPYNYWRFNKASLQKYINNNQNNIYVGVLNLKGENGFWFRISIMFNLCIISINIILVVFFLFNLKKKSNIIMIN